MESGAPPKPREPPSRPPLRPKPRRRSRRRTARPRPRCSPWPTTRPPPPRARHPRPGAPARRHPPRVATPGRCPRHPGAWRCRAAVDRADPRAGTSRAGPAAGFRYVPHPRPRVRPAPPNTGSPPQPVEHARHRISGPSGGSPPLPATSSMPPPAGYPAPGDGSTPRRAPAAPGWRGAGEPCRHAGRPRRARRRRQRPRRLQDPDGRRQRLPRRGSRDKDPVRLKGRGDGTPRPDRVPAAQPEVLRSGPRRDPRSRRPRRVGQEARRL